jgi:protein ImuA
LDKEPRDPLSPQPLAKRIFVVRSDTDESASASKRTSKSTSKRMCLPGGGAVAPFFAPPPAPPCGQARIERLRTLLATLERRQGVNRPWASAHSADTAARDGWTLGDSEVDGWLPGCQLDAATLGEIKPETYADTPAALSFALLLATRRLGRSSPLPLAMTSAMPASSLSGLVVWCWPLRLARESGGFYGPGLARLGLDPARLLLVETATPAETLWAMEESLGSGAAAVVIGCLDGIALTPARRLALAAAAHRTPALMVTAARSTAAAATYARWRVAAAPSAPHPFDPAAPGDPRFKLTLERCRGTALGAVLPSSVVEWSHDAYRFRVVAGMADRAPATASRA